MPQYIVIGTRDFSSRMKDIKYRATLVARTSVVKNDSIIPCIMRPKESYRHMLPHFQQPGQAYFVTWSLKNAVPAKALKDYSDKLQSLKAVMASQGIHPDILRRLKLEYVLLKRKYAKAYDDLLDAQTQPEVNLTIPPNLELLKEAFESFEGTQIENYAYCVMKNHIHWVFRTFEKDENQNPVYLQDILRRVKGSAARFINQAECREGTLWQKESFDTTIRNGQHLYRAVEYTIYNPVKAGLVTHWYEWEGTKLFKEFEGCFD